MDSDIESLDSPQQPHNSFSYLVRIVNPDCKSKFITKNWHDVYKKFASANQLKQSLISAFGDKLPPLSELECGYLEKCTNAKCWIEDDKDLEAMYKTFSENVEITLLCEGLPSEEQVAKRGKKRKADDTGGSILPKQTPREESIDQIVQSLREIHGEDYSGPQYQMWARMKLTGQHTSLEQPPPYPLFTGGTKKVSKHGDSLNEALTSAATAMAGILKGNESSSDSGSMSPGKRARVSGQYLEQLERLKILEQSGVLTPDEYEEQKSYAYEKYP